MSDETFGTCPFDSSHRILLYRMPAHVIKCRKNYRGQPMEQCIYNATHYIPMGTMKSHLQQCRDCYRFNESKYVKVAEKSMKQC